MCATGALEVKHQPVGSIWKWLQCQGHCLQPNIQAGRLKTQQHLDVTQATMSSTAPALSGTALAMSGTAPVMSGTAPAMSGTAL